MVLSWKRFGIVAGIVASIVAKIERLSIPQFFVPSVFLLKPQHIDESRKACYVAVTVRVPAQGLRRSVK